MGQKRTVHTLVKKTYQLDKPIDDDNWWKHTQSPDGHSDTAKSNLLIVAARLTAHVPKGGTDDADVDQGLTSPLGLDQVQVQVFLDKYLQVQVQVLIQVLFKKFPVRKH